jgi:bifunctional non-homologous end joining protein LigD
MTRRRASPLPAFIPPQLTALVRTAPDGEGWLHGIKFDGYRMHARIDVLHLDGEDLTKLPLHERKQRLAALLTGAGAPTSVVAFTRQRKPVSFPLRRR